MPLVTVVVPAYGRPRFLDELLDSLLSQPFDDFEVVIVDDASPESIAVRAHPRVRLVRRATNGGPSAARNTGVAAAAGQWVGFADDDDVVTPVRFTSVVPLMERADIVVCGSDFLDGGQHAYGRRRLDGDLTDTLLDAPTPTLGQVLVRRELVQPFDERLRTSEDIEWWIRMAGAGRFASVADIGYRVRRHPEVRHGIATRDRLDNRLWTWRRHEAFFRTHRRAAAGHAYRIAAGAYLVGRTGPVVRWSVASLRRSPNRPAAALLGRSVLQALRRRGRRGPGTGTG